MENMISHSTEYTTDLIKWINIQNQLMAKAIEVLKDYVKSYHSAIVMMAKYYSNIIKEGSLCDLKYDRDPRIPL